MSQNHNKPVKAYKNSNFINSPSARLIRILAEMIEPKARFQKYRIRNTVVFFGSARTLPEDTAVKYLQEIEDEIDCKKNKSDQLITRHIQAKRDVKMARFYTEAADLAEKLTYWFKEIEAQGKLFNICTGGGPGIMEAANLGASRANGRSVGLNISLPFEQGANRYQTRELSFEFHYFFIRKFWFVYLAKALIVFPGGFGTFDELFELLTLIQTGKTTKKMPVVLYGAEYWNQVLNFDAMVNWGTISPHDLDLFKICSDVDEAFAYITKELEKRLFSKKNRRT